eukprot:bmy_01125T0
MTLSLQERHGDSLEAECLLQCRRRASSVPLNPSGQTGSGLGISPGPTYPRMVWNTAHSPVTQPPFCFQGCISPLDCCIFEGMHGRKLSRQAFWCPRLSPLLGRLCYFNYHDVGICKAVAMLWHL